MTKIKSYIAGIGHYLPDKVITNDYLSNKIDTSDEWITERTGIKERRYVEDGVGPSDLAIPAVNSALKDANKSKEEIDLIIFATISPDYYIPGSGCMLQDKMGFSNIGAFDIRAACSGFIYGISMADQYIKTGEFSNILLVCAEVQSTTMDLSDRGRNTAVIFGDGAAAVVVSSTEQKGGIMSTHLHSDGRHVKQLYVKEPSTSNSNRLSKESIDRGDHFISMNGREVFRHAVKRFPEAIDEAIQHNNLTYDDISLIIPHQANLRITEAIKKKLSLKDDQVYSNIHKYGNTTAASIPICLSEARDEGKIKSDDIIVCAAFGSGFLWGSTIIKWQ